MPMLGNGAAAARLGSRADWLPRAAGALAAIVGVVNVTSTLMPHANIDGVVPTLHALALPAGVALLVVAFYLERRRRNAWRAAVALLVVLAVLNLLRGFELGEAALSLGLAGLLIWGEDAFDVAPERVSARLVFGRAVAIAGSAYLAALVAVWAAHGSASPHTTWPRALAEAGDLLLLTGGPLHFRSPFAWLPVGVGLLGLGAMLALAWTLFRPLAAPLELPGLAARRRARELVEGHGDDTLSYFKLREDKHYLFAQDARAFLGYRVESGVLLVSGDPVGPREARPELAAATLAMARSHGLRVGVLGASEDAVAVWREAGLHALYIGDEAIVELERFSLEGRRIRKVRQSVHRLERAGYTVELRVLGELDPATLEELEAVAARFLRGAPDKSFAWSMDTLRGAHQRDSLVVIARDGTGAARGFLHFVPAFGRAAMSLSFMRRDRDTPNGLTEFLVACSIALLRERGVEELSLNFAAFARWMHAPASARERFFGGLARAGSAHIQMESLYRFNAKFMPRWDPRYLVYEGRLGFLRAGLASMWIEGQAPRPRLPLSGRR